MLTAKSQTSTNFSVNELDTMIGILNARTQRGSAIRDLRLLNKLIEKIKSVKPAQPVKELDVTIEGDEEATKALAEKNQKEFEIAWQSYPTWSVELDLTPTELTVIKSKFVSFDGFMSDENSRTQILALADKLGI